MYESELDESAFDIASHVKSTHCGLIPELEPCRFWEPVLWQLVKEQMTRLPIGNT